nr:TRAP transporter large permease subunit [Desulfolutivibrio sulfodismutans]
MERRGSVATTVAIMPLIYCIIMFSRGCLMEDLLRQIMDALTSIAENKDMILLMTNVFMVSTGMLMDDARAVLRSTQILLPGVAQLGVGPVHFAALAGVKLGLGNVTPPTAPLLSLSGQISGAPRDQSMKTALYLILFAWLPTRAMTTFVPDLALWLPRLLLGSRV